MMTKQFDLGVFCLFLSWFLFYLFIFNYVVMCVGICTWVQVPEEARGIWSFGARVTDSCELPGVAAGNPPQILCKSNAVLNQLSLVQTNFKRPEEGAGSSGMKLPVVVTSSVWVLGDRLSGSLPEQYMLSIIKPSLHPCFSFLRQSLKYPCWLWTPYVAKDDLEPLIHLPLPPKH